MVNQDIQNIDQYIDMFNAEIREFLHQVRTAIQEVAPLATECIKYAMPTYVYFGNLVHFSACKSHLGFYPAPSGIIAFNNQLTQYKCSKGAIQFPYNAPLPIGLIQEIVKFRLKENEDIANSKRNKKNM